MRATRRWDHETAWVAAMASCVSVVSFLLCFRHGAILLYGDAVAHSNIARRVFDSRTPGPLQLGTVWLPLPHLLMMPFLLSGWMWRTGAGGSIPSMAGFVAGAVGVFRLVRGALSFHSEPDMAVRLAAWAAALTYAANPNLIYLQATAMTESLYLALFIWAVVFFSEFQQRRSKAWDETSLAAGSGSLQRCGYCLAGAELTRYDGWFAAGVIAAVVLLMHFKSGSRSASERRSVAKFVVLVTIVPVLWLAYNGIIYRNPLEFANGPYSARAIEQKSASPGFPPHPRSGKLRAAATYFWKSAELNTAEGRWQKIWVALSLAAGAAVVIFAHRLAPVLLLWMPFPFYVFSVAYAGVPILVPVWWPFSYYNVRYGLQLLPMFAASLGVVLYFAIMFARNTTARVAVGVAALALVAGSYASVWRERPICYREAWMNSRTRMALETELARELRKLPPNATLLMYLGDHVGALQQAGIPLQRVIQEGNHRTWKQPSDPEGLWERALADPARYADYVVAIMGDPVAKEVNRSGLQTMVKIHTLGQPEAAIYWTGSNPAGNQPR